MWTIVSMWVTFRGLSGICAKYENLGGGNNAERGTEGENGVRKVDPVLITRSSCSGRKNKPAAPTGATFGRRAFTHFRPPVSGCRTLPSFRQALSVQLVMIAFDLKLLRVAG